MSFSFDKMKEVIFDFENGAPLENELRKMFMKLKDKDRARWKTVLHDYAVTSSLYVNSFKATFKRDGQVETDVNILTKDISFNAHTEWSASGELTISGNNTPFGVRGFIIKRFM